MVGRGKGKILNTSSTAQKGYEAMAANQAALNPIYMVTIS